MEVDYIYWWSKFPDLPFDALKYLVDLNVDASDMFHMYFTNNHEAQ